MGHVGAIGAMARANASALKQDGISGFVCQHTVKALPQLRILGCYPANAKFFYLHLGDPFSHGSLVLPIAYQWVEECKLDCDSSVCRLERLLNQAAEILDSSGRFCRKPQTAH